MKTSEFHAVYGTPEGRDTFFLFLENIFHLYPEKKFHLLIQEACKKFDNDEAIYKYILEKLSTIKPFLSEFTYALPSLWKQKKEMAKQTVELLGNTKVLNGYAEIGSTGRYISKLKDVVPVKGPIYLIHDVPASNSPEDIMERGQLFKLGSFIPLENYKPITPASIPDESLDMVTCYIGLHHCTPDRMDGFVDSIFRVLRKGGMFVLRDHDVKTDYMQTFVSLVHTVFNSGVKISWEVEHKDYKKFKSVEEWSQYFKGHGFKDVGKYLLQEKDPSLNTLMGFVK